LPVENQDALGVLGAQFGDDPAMLGGRDVALALPLAAFAGEDATERVGPTFT
jgi:hypothetical protein